MCRLQLLLKYTNTLTKSVGSRLLSTTSAPKNELLERSVLAKVYADRSFLLDQDKPFTDNLTSNVASNRLNRLLCKSSVFMLNSLIEFPKSSLINEVHLPYIHEIDSFKLPPIRDIQDIGKQKPVNHIEAPAQNDVAEKQAARLIVIRRRKMKKHKLKKLRIKMKYEWAKVRQRREMRKEKLFQAQLISKIKEAEKFNAEQYVAERLQEYRRLVTKH